MFSTKVTAKVVQDNSGVATEIPVILTDQGVLGSVTDYVLSLHLNGTSLSTITNHIQSIRLLIEFMDANEGMFDKPEALFAGFVRRLYPGFLIGPQQVSQTVRVTAMTAHWRS